MGIAVERMMEGHELSRWCRLGVLRDCSSGIREGGGGDVTADKKKS